VELLIEMAVFAVGGATSAIVSVISGWILAHRMRRRLAQFRRTGVSEFELTSLNVWMDVLHQEQKRNRGPSRCDEISHSFPASTTVHARRASGS
jgi:hypothetical protein